MSNHVLRLHPARRALRFEPLEARHLLAVFTVNTALDTVAVDANVSALDAAGHISLRSAIQRANALAGADSINLPAGTYNLTIGGAARTSRQRATSTSRATSRSPAPARPRP